MGYDSGSASQDGRDEDDDEEYEEASGGSRFLGFMFGNVDNSGDLDADYLDEDAKEHLGALADKLGSSLTDMDLSVKSPRTAADASEQDYGEKAEDAVDFEDFDEQYDGPEVQGAGEEDHLIPEKDYISAQVSLTTLANNASVFDDENYDEDEETELVAEGEKVDVQTLPVLGGDGESPAVKAEEDKSPEGDEMQFGSSDVENFDTDPEELKEDVIEVVDSKKAAPLPVLCIEDGMVILRFSDIFGIHEPLKKGEKRSHGYSFLRDRYKAMNTLDIVEEDEEAFLKGFGLVYTSVVNKSENWHTGSMIDDTSDSTKFGTMHEFSQISLEDNKFGDSCLSAQPMKDNLEVGISLEQQPPFCTNVFAIDQQEWEDKILWENSPIRYDTSAVNCIVSSPDMEGKVIRDAGFRQGQDNLRLELHQESEEEDNRSLSFISSLQLEDLGSRNLTGHVTSLLTESTFHPQMLRLESWHESDDNNIKEERNVICNIEPSQTNAITRFSRLTLQNRDLLEGSWVDNIIWEQQDVIPKPKLILDLQDEQMLFEILDHKNSKHLRLHAGAMVMPRSGKSSGGLQSELPSQDSISAPQFNIANDLYYSKRKVSQQLKSNLKKRVAHGVKVHHSAPALKLQTMKVRLSNKDIANFHRPKAAWYPHDNEVAVKEQGKLPTQGPMKIILKSLGGKGSKLHVDSEETVSSVKAKASKKLDYKPSEIVRMFYLGKELEDHQTLVVQNVQPNSLLHLVRTKIQLWPKAQKVPGENKSLRPPGAFKKKSDLSVKDGHVFLMEYCEERPLLLSNAGMGAKLCTYYQKSSPSDQTGNLLRSGNDSLGNVLSLDPADKSPFLGDIKAGCSQSSLETNMYRAPVFPHKVPPTDYLLVRSAKGKLSIRRIDRVDVVGQQEPLMEVMSPGTKGLQTYLINRLYVYVCCEFRASEKRGLVPLVRSDDLSLQFPNLSEAIIRKKMKDCAFLQRDPRGQYFWVMKRNFRIPSEEDLRSLVRPENVCAYESMLAGLYRLKHLGITRLTHPTGISSATSQLPDEAIALAAASHIERELQITPWNLSSNFVACTSQGREYIERLEITGVGDPSGRGLGFSFVRAAPKAPTSNAAVKKKTAAGKGGSTVTGTDADLRRLSMGAAHEVLSKFNVPEDVISKLTRWHRIAMIRKLSSEQAASGVKVDPSTISKYARGQRMSFLQLQQQTREKCQEIWDRQVQCLSAFDGDGNDSEPEENSDLDSFAGDLENLLDAEEFEEDEHSTYELKDDKADFVKGLKMRRRPIQVQAEEEIEDEAAEAAELCRMLMDDDEAVRKKKKAKSLGSRVGMVKSLRTNYGTEDIETSKKSNTTGKQFSGFGGSSTFKENIVKESKEVGGSISKKSFPAKAKGTKRIDIVQTDLLAKRIKILADGSQNVKIKKSAREKFVCGACGQLGHMKTNKNCPRYRENLESQFEYSDLEKASGRPSLDLSSQSQQKSMKRLISKSATKIAIVDSAEEDKVSTKSKVPVKFKFGSSERTSDKPASGPAHSSEQPVSSDAETGSRSVGKVSKIVFSNKMKPEDVHSQNESHRPSIVIRPPAVTDREQVESEKSSHVIRPSVDMDREKGHKKLIIKRAKEVIDLDQISQDESTASGYRKTKKIVDLSDFEKHQRLERVRSNEERIKRKGRDERNWWEEEERRRNTERAREERERRHHEEEMRIFEEQERLAAIRTYEEALRREREEEERQKAKKKKKKKKRPDTREDYLDDYRARRNDRRMQEKERGTKRRPVVDLGRYSAEFTPATKRRKGGEVGLANILERIVESLKTRIEVSFLFLKPVSKKEAPDYLDIVERPMDLSTIRDKVRKLEYKSREDFRHDVWQITYNAHLYNDGRNPGIPPLADQLLELCDYLLNENDEELTEAEEGIDDNYI